MDDLYKEFFGRDKPLISSKGVSFTSWEQWGDALEKFNQGKVPCPRCGEIRQVWFVPQRYKKALPAYFVIPDNWHACAYCIAYFAGVKRNTDFEICRICNEYKRKGQHKWSTWEETLRKNGYGHHVWKKRIKLAYPCDSRWSCPNCEAVMIAYLEAYKLERHKETAFEMVRTSALKREQQENDDPLTFSQWRNALLFFGEACAFCGQEHQARDHVFPVIRGGQFIDGNIVPACTKCNSSKRDRNPILWARQNIDKGRFKRLIFWIVLHSAQKTIAARFKQGETP